MSQTIWFQVNQKGRKHKRREREKKRGDRWHNNKTHNHVIAPSGEWSQKEKTRRLVGAKHQRAGLCVYLVVLFLLLFDFFLPSSSSFYLFFSLSLSLSPKGSGIVFILSKKKGGGNRPASQPSQQPKLETKRRTFLGWMTRVTWTLLSVAKRRNEPMIWSCLWYRSIDEFSFDVPIINWRLSMTTCEMS